MSSGQNEIGEVDLAPEFIQQIRQLCMTSDQSDVTFIVEGAKLPAHKIILAARSSYFRALLFGGLSETTQCEIELDVPLVAFKALLQYTYSGCISLRKLNEEQIMDSLGLADQYGFESLKSAISNYFADNLSLDNCCRVLNAAHLFNLEGLIDVCLKFMDRNSADLLGSSRFETLAQESLCALLDRDTFFAPEIKIFVAVHEWCKSNPDTGIAAVLSKVRLPLMSLEQLLELVRPCNIVDSVQLLNAIQEKGKSKNIRYRGALHPEVNVATSTYGSKTIRGSNPSSLLNGDITNYDNGVIGDGIIVELGSIFFINHIKLLLWDGDLRSGSYYIETSVDQNNWKRHIDYTEHKCRSWQFLYFQSHPVRYIKLVGTRNTIDNQFRVVTLEAYHKERVPTMLNGIISPTHNVATKDNGAYVIEGLQPEALLDGDVKNYNGSSGYTYHRIGRGAITIQLGQPYHIGSLRLLLWDNDRRTYRFFIETSVNQKDWEMAVDKRNENLRSWQKFEFSPRPVAFFRIIGTQHTLDNDFHLVHFESPAQ